MPLNDIYRKDPPYVASYDYFDIANGTGYDIYYGIGITNSVTTTSTVIVKSGIPCMSAAITAVENTTFLEVIDRDFDITFNTPKKIKGDFLAGIPIGYKMTGAAAQSMWFRSRVLVYHFDGSTETQLGSTSTSEAYDIDAVDAANEIGSKVSFHKVTIPLRHFKAGETLRITVKVDVKATAGTGKTCTAGMGCDPTNEAPSAAIINYESGVISIISDGVTTGHFGETNTKMEFHVPFKLNINI